MTAVLRTGSLSLRRNATWTLVGQLVYAAAQFGMLVVLARLTDPESLGRFTLALAVTAPVLMFTSLQLRGLLASDARGATAVGVYVALRCVTTVLGLAVVLVIAGLGPYGGETAVVLVVVGATKSVEALSDVLHGYLHRLEQLGVVARSTMTRGVLSLLALGGVQAVTGDLVLATVGMLVVATGVLVGYDVPAARRQARRRREVVDPVRPVFSAGPMRQLAWSALPLGAVMLLVSLTTTIPRYAVEAHLGEAALGVFSALAYAMVLLTPVVNALGQAALPRLARAYTQARPVDFTRLVSRLLLAGLVIGAIGVLVSLVVGRELLSVLYGPLYAQHLPTFVVVMTAAALSSVASFCGFALTAARFLRSQAVLLVLVVAVVALASHLLIPREGIIGAALALVAGAGVQMAGALVLLAISVRVLGARSVSRAPVSAGRPRQP